MYVMTFFQTERFRNALYSKRKGKGEAVQIKNKIIGLIKNNYDILKDGSEILVFVLLF